MTGEPVDAQSIKGIKNGADRHTRGRGSQATNNTHAGTRPLPEMTANASPKARETAVNHRSGQDPAEVPPMKERPEVGGGKPDP